MALHITGVEVKNRGHTYYEMKCDECSAIKLVRKDHVIDNMECNALRHMYPEIAKLLNDTENEFDYSVKSGKIAEWRCPHCNTVFKRRVKNVINRGFICPSCSSNISYPNRYMYAFLKQLKCDFESEKIFIWSNNKRYDFYVPDKSLIIEMHGLQHYRDCGYYQKYEEIHANDLNKEKMAKNNGILNYICIDASCSDFNFISKSILKSFLVNIFDVNKIDFCKLEKDIDSYTLKEIVDMWNDGKSVLEITSNIKTDSKRVVRLLKKANDLNLCSYDATKQANKWLKVSHILHMKKVVCVNTGQIYRSINEAAISNDISPKALSNCLTGRTNSCGKDKITNKKLYWNYKEDL